MNVIPDNYRDEEIPLGNKAWARSGGARVGRKNNVRVDTSRRRYSGITRHRVCPMALCYTRFKDKMFRFSPGEYKRQYRHNKEARVTWWTTAGKERGYTLESTPFCPLCLFPLLYLFHFIFVSHFVDLHPLASVLAAPHGAHKTFPP